MISHRQNSGGKLNVEASDAVAVRILPRYAVFARLEVRCRGKEGKRKERESAKKHANFV